MVSGFAAPCEATLEAARDLVAWTSPTHLAQRRVFRTVTSKGAHVIKHQRALGGVLALAVAGALAAGSAATASAGTAVCEARRFRRANPRLQGHS